MKRNIYFRPSTILHTYSGRQYDFYGSVQPLENLVPLKQKWDRERFYGVYFQIFNEPSGILIAYVIRKRVLGHSPNSSNTKTDYEIVESNQTFLFARRKKNKKQRKVPRSTYERSETILKTERAQRIPILTYKGGNTLERSRVTQKRAA